MATPQSTATTAGTEYPFWWVGVSVGILTLMRPVWGAVTWVFRKAVVEPLELRIIALEVSHKSLHEKIDLLLEDRDRESMERAA